LRRRAKNRASLFLQDAAAKFKEVTLAFRTLSDPGSRQAYLREFSQRLKVDLSWRPAEADVDIETRVKAEAERRARMEAQRKLDAVKFRSQVLSEVRERLSLAQKLKRDETYRKELREKLLDQGGEETAGAGDSSYRKRAARPLDPRTARAAKHARFVDKARRTVDAQSDSEASKPRKASSPQPESASSAEGSRREKASDLENGQEAAK
jgi:hypothetical protein